MPRTILHLDLDAFFCAVEEQRDPSLTGQPFAVGGQADQRGVVASCSYAARQYGVHSAMPMAQAVRLCPDLQIVGQHFDAYRAASRRVMDHLQQVTPLVEQISIDEAFLDVTGLDGPATARRLQAEIRDLLGLPCSFGVATNKLVAKIANTVGKGQARSGAPPNAITIVSPGEEAAFLAPLAVTELWGVGPRSAERLAHYGVNTIGELAQLPEPLLVRLFGKTGADLAQRARGIDTRPVEPEHDPKSISRETTFTRDVADGAELRHTLRQLADGVGWRLRKAGLRGTTVKIKLRWSDFTTLTRQVTLPQPTDDDAVIHAAVLDLFEKTWTSGRPVRLLGVGVSGFDETPVQLGLWDAPAAENPTRDLLDTLDRLRERYGERVIRRSSDLD